MTNRKTAFAVLSVLLLQALVPVIGVNAETSGRTTPDFSVPILTLSGGGSVDDGGQITLAPGEHIIRIVVANNGPVTGSANLEIVHKLSPSSSENVLTTISIDNLQAVSQTNPILYTWTAPSGDDQTIFARVSSGSDSNTGNNEASLNFDVTTLNLGTAINDNIPSPSGGFSYLRLNHSIHSYTATVRNDGVMPLSATFELNFTHNGNGTEVSFWSDTVILLPGNLVNPTTPDTVTVSFNAANMMNAWTMNAIVHFNGTSWDNQVPRSSETVVFSDYIIDIGEPATMAIEPGATFPLTWVINNLGESDTLTVELGSDLGWHDNSLHGSSISIGVDESTTISVSVTVPNDAVKPTLENVYLNLTSTSTEPYTARSVGHVMVGDQYQATIEAPLGPITVTPSQTSSLQFNINNSGNVPAAFDLATGLSALADNWIVELSTPRTDVIPAGQSITVYVQVTPAPVSSPLVQSERNGAGDSLYIWMSATPTNGGIPTFNQTQMVIRAVIAVDPGPVEDEIILTEEEILNANGSGGINKVIGLLVEVKHNLGSGVAGGVGANITAGNYSFIAGTSGGLSESERWQRDVSPEVVSGLNIGTPVQSFLAIDGPGDLLPLAGTLRLPVTATPILTASQQASGVLASSVTRNITIIVPSITLGEIVTEGPLDADVGNETEFDIQLANTGNNHSSYRVVIQDDLPDLWTATLDTGAGTTTTVDDLPPSMHDTSNPNNDHVANLTLSVITDPQAPADTFQPLTLRVEDKETGELLSTKTLMIRVEESVNFELEPTNHTIDLSPYETPMTRVFINNTGNVITTYSVWLDTSLANDVTFGLESPTELVVAPGFKDSIKIRLNPNPDASADEFHMVTVWVEADNGMNLSASVVANISADHALTIDVESLISVIPGEQELIDVTFGNNGNTEELLDVVAVIEGNWTNSWQYESMVIPIDGTITNELTIDIPALGGNYSLANGDIHEVTISLYDSDNGEFLAGRTIQLSVAPVFIVEIENWPDEQYYHTGLGRDWIVTLTNVGNKEVTIDLDYEILKPGLEIPSIAWEVDSTAPNSKILPIGVPIELRFSVIGMELDPSLLLEAELKVTMTPDDDEVTGTTVKQTSLKMSRLFNYGDFKLKPAEDDSNLTQGVIYEHIPIGGAGSAVQYMLELCGAERRVNLTDLGLDPEDFMWSFGIDVDGVVHEFNLTNDCENGDHSNVITLPAKEAYEWTENELQIIVNPPNRPNILKNDGYDLTFKLYHPDEHNGYSESTNATFAFYFDTVSIPTIADLSFADGQLLEGADSSITATLRNDGTSLAVAVKAELVCDGVEVSDPVFERPFLGNDDSIALEWKVRTDELDWWAQSSEVNCNVILTANNWDNTAMEPKNFKLEGEVESWSPDIGISFIATLGLIILSVVLLRLVGQNDKFRLAATYSGVMALGFAFHLMNMAWWGPVVLFMAASWVWTMTWKSSVEFQLIHEDYQRARKGVSTLYSDHYEVLSNSKRQLTIILAMPVLGMIGVIIGFPPQLSSSSENVASLVAYLLVVVGGVVILIWNANRLYGSLYGRLTEVEIQASKIERDLGDPARLLTELASDGLDLSSLISQPRPNVAAEGDASSSDVAKWDEDTHILLNDEFANSHGDSESLDESASNMDYQESSEPNTMESLEAMDLPSPTETIEEISEEIIQPENQNNSIGVDLDDLFVDDEQPEGGGLSE